MIWALIYLYLAGILMALEAVPLGVAVMWPAAPIYFALRALDGGPNG